MFSLRSRRSAAFTLLELVVVVVILGVLAALAIPTFSAVLDRSADRVTQTSLASFARSVQAQVALGADRAFSPDDFEAAAPDFTTMAASPGVSAASFSVLLRSDARADRFEPQELSVVSYAVSSDGAAAGIAAVSPSGSCVGVRATLTQVVPAGMPSAAELCTGFTALNVSSPQGAPSVDPENPGTLQAPIVLAGSRTPSSADVSWNAVQGATSYRVEVAASSSMSGAVSETVVGRTYTVPVAAGTSKWVRVTALSTTSASVPSAAVEVFTALPAPENLTLDLVGRTATLQWDVVPGAAGYNIYQDGSGTITRTVSGEVSNTFTFVLAPSQVASFVVKAYNEEGLSAASNSVSGTVTATAPAGVTAVVSGSKVLVSWSKVDAASGYDVLRNGLFGANVSNVDTTSYQFDILPGETLSFAVKSYDPGGAGAASPEVSVTAAPAAPVLSGVKDTAGTGVVLSWSAPSGAASYRVLRDGVEVFSGTAATFSQSGLAYATSFSYQVVAVNGGGLSEASNTVTFVTVPAAPTGVQSTPHPTNGTAALSWSPVPGALNYTVTYLPLGTTQIVTVPGATTGELAPVAEHTYKVVANGAGGSSAPSTVTAVPSYAWAVKYSDPVGYWRLDETSGASALDSSGKGRNGTYAGTVAQGLPGAPAGAPSTSIDPRGTGQVNLSGLPMDTAAGGRNTFEGWVKWDGNPGMVFGFRSYDLVLDQGKLGFNSALGDNYGVPSTGMAGRWVHVAAVFYNGNTQQSELYVDGVKQSAMTLSSTTGWAPVAANAYATGTAQIGGWGLNNDYRFRGNLDEVSVYNRALTQAEIIQHYRAGIQG